MSPLPFLQLPLLASRRTLELLDNPTDVFNLSLTSCRIHRFMEKSKYKCENIHFASHDGIHFYIKIAQLSRYSKYFEMKDYSTTMKDIKIGTHSFKYDYTLNHFHHHNPLFGLVILFKHLFTLFVGPVHLTLTVSNSENLSELSSHEEFKKCEKLMICELGNERSHLKEINEILEAVEVSKHLEVFASVTHPIEFQNFRHLTSIFLRSAPWLTLSHLISLNCKTIFICGQRLSKSDVLAFVANWKAGNMENLELLHLSWFSQVPWPLNVAPKLNADELGAVPWDGKRRPGKYRHPTHGLFNFHRMISCTEGSDIIRPDGRIATWYQLDEFKWAEDFNFIVWTVEQLTLMKETDN